MRNVLMAAVVAVAMFAAAPPALAQNLVEDGAYTYFQNCAICHGLELQSSGATFDLRELRANEKPRFLNSVLNGKDEMPPWKDMLDMEEINSIWAYIRANAYKD